jgi:hypothetical protein
MWATTRVHLAVSTPADMPLRMTDLITATMVDNYMP